MKAEGVCTGQPLLNVNLTLFVWYVSASTATARLNLNWSYLHHPRGLWVGLLSSVLYIGYY